MRGIAFFSLKGMMGKTTTSVDIAVALAQAGGRPLWVDLDSNAYVSAYPGVYADLEGSVGAVLLRECGLPVATKPVVDGPWLVLGSSALVTPDKTLAREAEAHNPAYTELTKAAR